MSNLIISDILANIKLTFRNVAIIVGAALTLGVVGHTLLVKSTQVLFANRRRSREN